MDYNAIVDLAKDMGLNDSRARVAAAIAMAESGGDPGAVVHDSDDDSYGLWQINMKGALGPDRRRQYGLPNNDALLDPRRNAMVMADMSSKGGNFNAWTTYTAGTYKKFLTDKSIIDKLSPSNVGGNIRDSIDNTAGQVQDLAGAASTAATAVTKSAAWISDSKNWVRIGYVLGGATIAVVAIAQLLKGTSAGEAAKTVTKKTVNAATAVATRGASTLKGKK